MINDQALDALFRTARTQNGWLDQPVSDDELRQLYELLKFGPTAANSCPARFVFLRTPEAKERLRPAMSQGNLEKTMKAPVVTIVAYDTQFHELLPKLFPHNPGMKAIFDGPEKAALREVGGLRNSSLQGGYFILAARAIGLECGPMSGFDSAKVDAEFFPDGRFKTNFVCNLGHGDASKVLPRLPRLSFEEACQLL